MSIQPIPTSSLMGGGIIQKSPELLQPKVPSDSFQCVRYLLQLKEHSGGSWHTISSILCENVLLSASIITSIFFSQVLPSAPITSGIILSVGSCILLGSIGLYGARIVVCKVLKVLDTIQTTYWKILDIFLEILSLLRKSIISQLEQKKAEELIAISAPAQNCSMESEKALFLQSFQNDYLQCKHNDLMNNLSHMKYIPSELYSDPIFSRNICPLSKMPIRHPVQEAETHVLYEKLSIEKWIETYHISPQTGLVLEKEDLISREDIEAEINERLEEDQEDLYFIQQKIQMLNHKLH